MANPNEDVKVGITSETGGLKAGMEGASGYVSSAVASITGWLERLAGVSQAQTATVIKNNEAAALSYGALKEKVEGIQGTMAAPFLKLNAAMGTFLAVLGGGAAFHKAIDDTNEFTGEVVKLGKTFGINSDQATTFAVALHEVGLSPQQAETAFMKFERQLRRNSDALTALGVDTASLKNGTKTSQEVFLEAIQIIGQYKEGHDRLQVAMQILGTRGITEVNAFLRLNKERMDEAEKSQRALGLTVTEESNKMRLAYKESMAGVDLVFKAIEKVIAENVMPGLIAMGQWFKSVGPAAVEAMRSVMATFGVVMGVVKDAAMALWNGLKEVFSAIGDLINAVFGGGGEGVTAMQFFRNVLALVQVAVIALGAGFQIVVEVIKAAIIIVVDYLDRFARTAERAFHLDWAGAQAAWNTGTKKIEDQVRASAQRIIAISKEAGEKSAKALMDAAAPPEAPKGTVITPKPGKTAPEGLGKHATDERLGQWKQYLEEAKMAEGFFHEMGKDQEEAYWAGKLETLDKNSEKDKKLYNEVYALRYAAAKGYAKQEEHFDDQHFETLLARYKEDETMAKQTMDQWLAMKAVMYKGDERFYENLIKKKEALDEEWKKKHEQVDRINAQTTQDIALGGIEKERQFWQQKLALRQINAQQMFQIETDLENQTYAEKQKELDAEYVAADNNIVKIAELNRKKVDLEIAHQKALTDIANKAELERAQAAIKAQEDVQNAFATFLEAITNRTKSFSQAFKDMAKQISTDLVKLSAENVAKDLLGPGSIGGGILGQLFGTMFGVNTGKDAATMANTSATVLNTTALGALTSAIGGASVAKAAEGVTGEGGGLFGGLFGGGGGGLFGGLFGGGGAGGGLGFSLASGGAAPIPMFAEGSPYVPRDMLAIVHRGEAVIPAHMNKGGGPGNMHIQNTFMFNGPVDNRTQAQIALATARAVDAANRRSR